MNPKRIGTPAFMKINFERSGGVGGFRLTAEVDTEAREVTYGAARLTKSLSAAEVEDLERIAGRVDLSNPTGGSLADDYDRFQYVITVESGSQRRTLRMTDKSTPAALQPLIDLMTRMSKGITEARSSQA
jgi:hypothetical protein